jgi:GT2 family glycosyltransferase
MVVTSGLPLSVVMPVRDALPYLDAAIASITRQSFADFEFVIIDDASRDGSREVLRGWAKRDSRIRLIESPRPLGPVASSQTAVEHSRGAVVARMDADDVSHPQRLARQMAALTACPDAALVGTLYRIIDGDNRVLRTLERKPLLRPLGSFPVPHGSIMFRRCAFDRAGGYRRGTDLWEDLDLFRRLGQQGRTIIIPDALYDHRASTVGTRVRSGMKALEKAYSRWAAQTPGIVAGPSGSRLPTAVFVLCGSPILWAGGRPNLLGPLLRRGALGLNGRSLATVAWACWAYAHPASLRLAQRGFARLGELRVPRWIADQPWLEWRSGSPLQPPDKGAPRRAELGRRSSV